ERHHDLDDDDQDLLGADAGAHEGVEGEDVPHRMASRRTSVSGAPASSSSPIGPSGWLKATRATPRGTRPSGRAASTRLVRGVTIRTWAPSVSPWRSASHGLIETRAPRAKLASAGECTVNTAAS